MKRIDSGERRMKKGMVRWALVLSLGAVTLFGLGVMGAGTSLAGGNMAGVSPSNAGLSASNAEALPGETASQERDVPSLLARGEALFVDVRTPQEFAQNGLEGAINIPVQELSWRIGEFGDLDRPVVIYCRTGSRSSQAKWILERHGYQTVHDLGAHWSAQRAVREAQRR